MEPTNRSLLTLLAKDLHAHFPQMVESYQYRLYIFALRLTGNAQEAEDIVQEAFFNAYVSLKKYPAWRIQTLQLQAWLYKVTLHVFDHHARGAQLQVIQFGLFQDSSLLEIEEGNETQPEHILESQEQIAALEAFVARLPERYRVVVACYYFEQLSYREIVDLLDLPLNTVKVNIHRGIRLLRTMLQDQEQEPGGVRHEIR